MSGTVQWGTSLQTDGGAWLMGEGVGANQESELDRKANVELKGSRNHPSWKESV